MKRVMLVLVFLVMWSVGVPVLRTGVALAGDQDTSVDGDSQGSDGGRVFDSYGAADDGTDGDPGSAGDGYGFTDDLGGSVLQGLDSTDPLWDQFLLLLMMQIQMEL